MTLNPVEIPHLELYVTRCGEFANKLDSCIELLSHLSAQMESIEKETERIAMLNKRMMEPPRTTEPELVPWKRRRRTRHIPMPEIAENATYFAPSAWPHTRRA